MRTFKDNKDRAWALNVDVNAMRRVRTGAQFNLAGKDFASILGDLLADPVMLCDVVYYVCKPEADRLGVSLEDFGAAMTGDPFEVAVKALSEEMVNFTPNPRDRARAQKVLEAAWNLQDKTREVEERRVTEGLAKMSEKILSGISSSTSPESPALTPAP